MGDLNMGDLTIDDLTMRDLTMCDVAVRDAVPADAAAMAAIYNHFVLNSTISFEESAVSPEDFAQRVSAVQDGGLPWIVIESGGVLAGYAYASKWRVRHAYRFSVEASVYIDHDMGGKAYGSALYTALLARLRAAGCHLVIGGIAQPNPASIALHEKFGFRKVAHFSEVGFKFGRWVDVGYWELKLEEAEKAT